MENINNLRFSASRGHLKRCFLVVVLWLAAAGFAHAGIGIGLEEMQKMFGPLRWVDSPPFTNGFGCAVFRLTTDHVQTRAVFQAQSNDTVVVEEIHSACAGYSIPPGLLFRLMDAATTCANWKIFVSPNGNDYLWKNHTFRCVLGMAFRSADDTVLCLIHRNDKGQVQHVQFISSAVAGRVRFRVVQ